MSQQVRIQNALRDLIQAGEFYPVVYDTSGVASTATAVAPIAPSGGVTVHELSSQVGEPRRNRQTYRQERRNWRWRAIASFSLAVTADVFEQWLLENTPRIERDVDNGLEQVHLRLVSVDYRHPPQHSSSSGSQVTFTFEAVLSPV